jgi:cytosine/adenosine deaminase-related metal-dependent hydrolase
VVQDDDEVLADSERLVARHHDASFGAMVRVALAPCSPFSVSPELMRRTAELAERLDVRLHTHLAEDPDEIGELTVGAVGDLVCRPQEGVRYAGASRAGTRDLAATKGQYRHCERGLKFL